MKQRIILLPGFGENCSIYDQLIPHLQDFELVHVEYTDVLNQVSFFNYSGIEIVKVIIDHYNIQPEDKIIGHSTGGYFAFLIREIMHNEICMIAGFSDVTKVVPPLPYSWFSTPFLGITGFYKTPLARKYILDKIKGKPIAAPMKRAMLQMKGYSNLDLFKLTMVLTYDEKPISILDQPLRIHAQDDKLVRLPDEPYIEVKGGHFPLLLDVEGTLHAMSSFLKQSA